ncbi:MAG: M1 family aminopeptidase [Rhodospirillales bacterium]|nr:M1 family aminopeptidase [Rhodospirillales bacterium]
MHKGIRLRTYFDSSIQDLAEGYLDKTADYLDLYQNWIGAYPFSAFHIVSSPLPVGLGFPNMTYIGTRVLRLPFIRHSSLGHEVLHSWWGNGVYVDYGSGNWAEGLTTFMADYTYVLNQGAEKGRAMRLNWLRDYMALPPERDRPLNKFVGKSHDASQVVGYNKTAFFFHMLRSQLGKAIFDKGIRIFWTRHRFKSAAWDDFRNAFEDASGQKLRVFFDQWLHRTGAPRIGLIRAEAEKKNGGYQVSLSLSQTAPVYNLKVPIEILTSEGTQQFVVSMTDKISRTTFNLIDRPRALAVDPDYDLFRKLDPAETPPILRDVTLGKSAVLILGKSEPFQKAAIILAEQLLDVAPRFLDGGALPDVPLLIVGMKKDVDKYLQAASILPEPAVLAGQGTARVWTGRRGKGQPYLVISADDVRAVSDLNRPLPHYLRQGFLVFSGSKVIKKGEWPAKSGSLKVRFDEY